MIQRKEILQQAIENGFINETSVYPAILHDCKSSQLQNYSIHGKTLYSENLFNYTEPYDDAQITADENGWFDVSIDNSSGGGDKGALCFTKVNLDLKPNTNYYLVLEVAERTGDINIRPCNDANGVSQFNSSLRLDSPPVGIRPPSKIVSKSTFIDESIKYMLHTYAFCTPGKSGHIKFRIAVYETEKDVFLPYSKNYVGDKTENVFNYTEPHNDAQIIADENGWFDVTIDNTKGTSTVYKNCCTKVNLDLKPNTNYYLVLEVAEKTGDIGIDACSAFASTSQFNTTLRFDSPDVGITPPQKIVSKSTFTGGSIKYMLRTHAFCTPGKSGHIKFRIAVYETEKNYFEPYDKYKIPITVTGKNLFDIDTFLALNGNLTYYSKNENGELVQVEADFRPISAVPTITTLPAGTYTLSISNTDVSSFYIIINGKNNGTGKASFTLTEASDIGLKFYESAETILGYIQIELSSSATEYEPYHEPVTTNIYRDAPLADGESINYKNDNLPDIMLKKGTNIITADTEVKPLEISASYKSHVRDYNSVKQYGVRWNGSVSTDCERLGDAVGLVANAHLGSLENVQNDFDDIYPWSDIRTCNVDANGNVLAYLGDSSFKRDGSNGDVMVKIPKFYYKRIKSGATEEFWICERQLPGYQLHPLFIDDGKEVSAVFHSAYNASVETLEDGTTILRSISSVQPAVRLSRASFRTKARNKGTGWSIEDISCVNALQMLYIVEYASTDSQSKLGKGVSSLNYTATHLAVEAGENTNEFVTSTTNANKYRVGERIEIGNRQGVNNITRTPRTITAITAREDDADISVITFDGDPVASIAVGNMIWNVAPLNGSCDELNGGSGYIGANGRADSAYRGIEGFHGKLFRFIDGVNIKDRLVHYANSIADYADGVYDGKYRAVGYTNGTANGYISEFGYDEKAPWVMFPTEANGGSTIYVPDYYYQNTGERLLLLGGYWTYDSFAGAFYFRCDNGFSNVYLTCGAHLLVKKPR